MTPNEYFTKIFCINLARRPDRWLHVEEQCWKHHLEVEKFEAYVVSYDGRVNGNAGCVASHRALLELIAYHHWPRVLILEDDFEIRHTDFEERFGKMIAEVPEWDMLYLGGGYGEAPQYRHSEHFIRCNRMMTTSSYGITWQMARKMAPYISGYGPIDSLYGQFNRDNNCYVFCPRLMVQYANFSDLTESPCNNEPSMTDPHHEDMLLGQGFWEPGGQTRWRSHLVRSELAAQGDMNGLKVIIGRQTYEVLGIIDLPPHPAPWRRGEDCTYIVKPCEPSA